MNSKLIYFLSEFCRQNPIEEKIFVVPSYRFGRQIGENLAHQEAPWINLRFMTLPALANEVAGMEAAARGLRQLTGPESMFLVEHIFRDLKNEGILLYFDPLETRPGIIKSILSAIKTLRLAGVQAEDIKSEDFVNEKKGREVKIILKTYEEELNKNKALDLAGLYRLACDSLDFQEKNQDRGKKDYSASHYLYLQDESLSWMEKTFIERLSGKKLVLIPRGKVQGLERPRRYWPETKKNQPALKDFTQEQPATDLQRMMWLFKPDATEAPSPFQDGTVKLFSAVGASNECREVFRRIIQADLPQDEVEILHPPKSDYPLIFYVLGAKAGLKLTLAEGIPLSFTSPGRVFNGLLNWLRNNYLSNSLCRLIESNSLRLFTGKNEEYPSPIRISRYIKNAMIGWGQDRYLTRLRSLKDNTASQMELAKKEGEQEKISAFRKGIREIEWLIGLIESFLALIPEVTGETNVKLGLFCEGISTFLKKFTWIQNNFDADALNLLTARLEEAGSMTQSEISRDESLGWIEGMSEGLRAGASGPLPGHLHLSPYYSGGYSGRPVTFIVGLDQGAFPGSGFQDPILLDEERKKISDTLSTTADDLRENLYSMASTLSSLRGEVILSYSSYDIIDDRESFPSSLLLQAYRLIKGDITLDYSDLLEALPTKAGIIPQSYERVFDDTDWWLAHLVNDGQFLEGQNLIRIYYSDLSRGISALEARESEMVTEFGGKIDTGEFEFHPYVNPTIVMSPSGLELLASCPFAYFLNYILGIKKPEELEYDPSQWLNPLQRGNLLHEVFQIFMQRLRDQGEQIDRKKHFDLIRKIARESILNMRNEVPPPSEGIFQHEKNELMDSLLVFLAAEQARIYQVEPILFEAGFGMKTGDSDDSLEKPVIIPVEGDKVIRLRGRIDRVDRIKNNRYRVIDYKTGSYSAYEDLVCFGQGKNLQHVLYSVAVEDILKNLNIDSSPVVEKSGYYFPTRQGEGREILIERERWSEYPSLLKELMDILEKGIFLIPPNPPCTYCDFAPICGTKVNEQTRIKKQSNPEQYAVFDRLKNYE